MKVPCPNIHKPGGCVPARYFFYGTLLDPDIQRLVLGRRLTNRQQRPATVHGYRRVHVRGAWYPTLAGHPGAEVHGAIVTGLIRDERVRLDWFEDDDYTLLPIIVSLRGNLQQQAFAYMPPEPRVPGDRQWTLEEWRRRFKRPFLMRSRRWMVAKWDKGW